METSAGFICLLVILHVQDVTPQNVTSETHFNYNRTADLEDSWQRKFMGTCDGQQQSPIDVHPNGVRYNIVCQCPKLTSDTSKEKGILRNDGHSAKFIPDTPNANVLTNIPHRPGSYYFHHFHFHYGGRNALERSMYRGSEHTLGGHRFEGEIHFVFYNSKYRNIKIAKTKLDGLVVVAFWIKTTASGAVTTFSEFLRQNIAPISAYKGYVKTQMDMTTFFNQDCSFYTYGGSLTTPPCYQSVRWLIRREPLLVNQQAWLGLNRLDSNGHLTEKFGNYRPTQPLYARVIEFHCSNSNTSNQYMPVMADPPTNIPVSHMIAPPAIAAAVKHEAAPHMLANPPPTPRRYKAAPHHMRANPPPTPRRYNAAPHMRANRPSTPQRYNAAPHMRANPPPTPRRYNAAPHMRANPPSTPVIYKAVRQMHAKKLLPTCKQVDQQLHQQLQNTSGLHTCMQNHLPLNKRLHTSCKPINQRHRQRTKRLRTCIQLNLYKERIHASIQSHDHLNQHTKQLLTCVKIQRQLHKLTKRLHTCMRIYHPLDLHTKRLKTCVQIYDQLRQQAQGLDRQGRRVCITNEQDK